ncbi:MAG: hypothetical protein WCJ56_15035, partial [bacterium]
NNNTIAIGHGSVNGKARALFLGGATADGDVYGLVTKTPTLNPLQAEFGGGASDGYVVMVDLAAGTPVVKAPTPPSAPIRLLIVNEGVKKPETATVTDFAFSATFPKWNHADAEIRVADGSYWPNFVAGNPDSGKATVTDTGVTGSLTANFNIWAQNQGKQDRRVLGQLFTDGTPPKFSLTVTSFAAKVTETLSYTDNKGATKERPVEYQTLDATLTIGNITVKVPFKAVGKRGGVAESALQRLNITAYATVKGSLLGLKDDLAEKDIDIRINVQGIDAAKIPAPPVKK